MDPILLRGIERIVIVIGAVFFAFLGYKLFLKGKDSGPGKLEVQSDILRVIVSGQGPGLFFMAFGAIILVFSIVNGGAKVSESSSELKNVEAYQNAITELRNNIDQLDQSNKSKISLLLDKVEKAEAENRKIHDYILHKELRSELKMVAMPKYSNDELANQINDLRKEMMRQDTKLEKLSKTTSSTDFSTDTEKPAN